MKEETVSLAQVIHKSSFQKVLLSVPLQIFNMENKLIFQGGSCETGAKIRGFPLSLPSGNIIGLIRTERKYKDIILEMINLELEKYFKQEKRDSSKALRDILFKDSVRLLRRGFVKDLGKLEGLIAKSLNILRSHFLFETAQIYVVRDDHYLTPFVEFSGEGPNFLPEEFNLDLGQLAQVMTSEKNSLYIEDCKDHEVMDVFFQDKQIGVKNLLAIPLTHGQAKLGAIFFFDFLDPSLSQKKIEDINSFVSLFSRIFMGLNNREKQKKTDLIFKDLKKYVSPKMVEMKRDEEVSLGGIEKEITVLFGQIHEFQKIYNALGAKRMMYLLNIHYEFLIKIAVSFGGNVDKILGESLMVVWNHPFTQEDPNLLAFEAAQKMMECSHHSISTVWRRLGVKNYSFGIGINTGKAVAGNLGSKDFMDFTVIGDTVNVAQRLETQASPWEVYLHENVANKIKDKTSASLKKVTGISLKGKAEDTTAFIYRDPNLTSAFRT